MWAAYGFAIMLCQQGDTKSPTMADLDKLVALYQELHLPVPPANAPLADRGYREEKGRFTLVDCGYAVPGKNKHGWYTFFLGTETDEDPDPAKPVIPEAKTFDSLECIPRTMDRFDQPNSALAMAVIERLRGHNEFALAILQKWAGPRDHPDYGPTKDEPTDMPGSLAGLARQHWYNACLDPSSDRAVIAGEMRSLLKRFPKLNRSEFDVVGRVSDTITRLELTIKDRYHGPDKVEQLIDSLCDGKADGGELESRGIYFTEHDFDTVEAIASIGYKAIPNLIAHFGDKRLVHSNSDGYRGFSSGPPDMSTDSPITSVGTVCSNLVAHFAPGRRMGGKSYVQQPLKEWWASASKKSDIDNCYEALTAKADFLSEGPIWFASAHHPDLLLKALDVILDRHDKTQIYNLLAGLVRSSLDRNVVKAALIKASKSTTGDQAHAAVMNLKKVSPDDNDAALIEILHKLPKSTDKPAWLSREAIYGKSVATSTSPKVWDAYLTATRRADLDLRLEMIQNAAYAEFTPTTRKLFLKYLSAFFDDKAEAAEPKEVTNRQHFGLPVLRVQYLALLLASYQLEMRKHPKKDSPEKEWQAFRKEVEAKLASEK